MIGGLNGYSELIRMSITYMPFSYGVPSGPLNDPLRWVRSSLLPAGETVMLEWVSDWRSASSLAIRRVRCVAISIYCEASGESERVRNFKYEKITLILRQGCNPEKAPWAIIMWRD